MEPNGFKALRVKLDDGIVYDLYHVYREHGKVVAVWPDSAIRVQDMNDIPLTIDWLHAAHNEGAEDEKAFWNQWGDE
jgi:hypothetical protein